MNVILKKTWKAKANQYQTEKGFSFHGTIKESDIDFINTRLRLISSCGKTGKLQFKMDNFGHFSANMNHDMQKYREEDYIVCIFDVLETLGWGFKFQFDSECASMKALSGSFTKRECFLFQKQNAIRATAIVESFLSNPQKLSAQKLSALIALSNPQKLSAQKLSALIALFPLFESRQK